MRNVTVYRVDYVKRSRIPIGTVVERRSRDRGDNLFGLLRLARRSYAPGAHDAFYIVVDSNEARVA